MTEPTLIRSIVGEGEGDTTLDQRLCDELDVVNAAATAGTPAARELTVRLLDPGDELVAGVSGWTWGVAAGTGMTWVRDDARGTGLGARLLADFESEARARGQGRRPRPPVQERRARE